jgi:hypothetical protein
VPRQGESPRKRSGIALILMPALGLAYALDRRALKPPRADASDHPDSERPGVFNRDWRLGPGTAARRFRVTSRRAAPLVFRRLIWSRRASVLWGDIDRVTGAVTATQSSSLRSTVLTFNYELVCKPAQRLF